MPAVVEEYKEEVKELVKRPSVDSVAAMKRSRHQSFLSTQFVPMRPIVHTREIETQTESEPLSTFATTETQTDTAETNSIRVQTENSVTKDGAMQTLSTMTTSIEA